VKRELLAIVLTFSTYGSAVALDLRAAQFPVEFGCRVTHTAGITREDGGKWVSGAIAVNIEPYRVVLEEFSRVRVPERKHVCNLSREMAGYPLDDGFCLTLLLSGSGTTAAPISSFCYVFNAPWRNSGNTLLNCGDGAKVFDTGEGVLISGVDAGGFLVGDTAFIQKADCKRLDR